MFFMISLINRHRKYLINYNQENINPLVIIKIIIKEASHTYKTGVRKKLYKRPNSVVKE